MNFDERIILTEDPEDWMVPAMTVVDIERLAEALVNCAPAVRDASEAGELAMLHITAADTIRRLLDIAMRPSRNPFYSRWYRTWELATLPLRPLWLPCLVRCTWTPSRCRVGLSWRWSQ